MEEGLNFGLWDLLRAFGALAFFIYGMKMMSEGIQKAAGSQLRNILRTMTRNRFIGVFSGFLVTALLQSSSATTVMIVSFANAGLLTLVESIGVIMGANIGTTVTAWLISILGFKMDISALSIRLIAFAVPMLFVNKAIWKNIGETLLGFAILFIGLSELKDSLSELKNHPETLEFLSMFTNYGMLSTVFFVLIGSILTVLIQSSSAAMALTLTLLFNNVITFEIAAAMVLGENIGTTVTANLAAIVGNVHAKRAARAHFIFNILGVIWMILLFPFFIDLVRSMWEPFQELLQSVIPDLDKGKEELQLSLFHTLFNIINTTLMIGFIPLIARVVTRFTPSTEDDDDEFKLKHISTSILTPELATIELQKEAAHFGEVTSRMSKFAGRLINSTDKKEQRKMLKKLKKYEKITDQMEIEITEYVTKLSNQEITPKTSLVLRNVLNICNDLERIGDIYYQMSKTVEQKIEAKSYFVPEQREGLNKMIGLVDKALSNMIKNLSTPIYEKVDMEQAQSIEREINECRDELKNNNLKSLGSPEYNVQSAMIFNNLFSSLERIGDHIINVTESIVGEI